MKKDWPKLGVFSRRHLLVILLILSVLIQGAVTTFPLALIILIAGSYFEEEKIFPYAFGVGLLFDFYQGGHLGVQAMIFLTVSLLTLIVKRGVLGQERGKLKLPYD